MPGVRSVRPSVAVGAGPRLHVGDGYGAWNASWEEWAAGSALARPAA